MPEQVITDMDNDAYHSDPAIGSSGLKLIKQSPAHYWAQYLDPERERDDSTPAQKMGTAIHMALLEPARFTKIYVVVPEGIDRRSNAGKALFAEIEANGQVPIKPGEYKAIAGMANSVHRSKPMRVLMQTPHHVEKSLFWKCRHTGVRCKMRPDLHIEPCNQFPTGLVVDLKKTTDAMAAEFFRSVWNYEMYLQAAWYVDGFMEVYGTKQPPAFAWIAVEDEPPYANKVHGCPESLIRYGRMKYMPLLATFAECLSTGVWPGYPETVSDLPLSDWATKIIETELSNH